MNPIIGYVTKADYPERFLRLYIDVHPSSQIPGFRSALGSGPIYTSIGLCSNAQDEPCFWIGWKERDDQRVNNVLLELYPQQPFTIDLAIVQVGDDGNIISLHGEEDKLHAYAAIQRYVLTYAIDHDYTDVLATIQFPCTLTSRVREIIKVRMQTRSCLYLHFRTLKTTGLTLLLPPIYTIVLSS